MLNKCKFCGSLPKFKEHYTADNYYIGKMNYDGMYLKCTTCGYKTSVGRGYEAAARYWNEANNEETTGGTKH